MLISSMYIKYYTNFSKTDGFFIYFVDDDITKFDKK